MDAIEMINSIVSDKKLIVYAKINGYYLANEDRIKNAEEDKEEIEFKLWSEL